MMDKQVSVLIYLVRFSPLLCLYIQNRLNLIFINSKIGSGEKSNKRVTEVTRNKGE